MMLQCPGILHVSGQSWHRQEDIQIFRVSSTDLPHECAHPTGYKSTANFIQKFQLLVGGR
jgi:hypothetical protein